MITVSIMTINLLISNVFNKMKESNESKIHLQATLQTPSVHCEQMLLMLVREHLFLLCIFSEIKTEVTKLIHTSLIKSPWSGLWWFMQSQDLWQWKCGYSYSSRVFSRSLHWFCAAHYHDTRGLLKHFQ